jgi:hypothetical protein
VQIERGGDAGNSAADDQDVAAVHSSPFFPALAREYHGFARLWIGVA